MNIAQLVLQPRRFFEEHGDSINWAWPLVGFYFFSYGSFFQQFVIHELHMPYWLVVFIVAWAPAVALAICLFVLLVLLWYWPASKILGTAPSLAHSTKIVGVSLLPAGVLFSLSLFFLASAKGNGVAAPYPLIVSALHLLFGLWALALIVIAAAIFNKFTTRKTILFVSWLAVLALVGASAYALIGEG